MGLSRNVEHDYEPVTGEHDVACTRCGKPWQYKWGDPPEKYCNGLRRSRISPVSDKKQRNRRDRKGRKHTYGPYFKWVSAQPCIVCGTVDGAPADHYKTVGSGGRDKANLIPVCVDHQDRHTKGLDTWIEHYDLTHEEVLIHMLKLWERYDAKTNA